MSPPFLVVEGLDFSGKTTVARFMIEELRLRQQPVAYNSAKHRLLRRCSKGLARIDRVPVLVPDLVFLLAILHDALLIAWRRWRGISVVQDRYYASYVWNQLTAPRSRRPILSLYRWFRPLLPEPDLVVHCRSPASALRTRYECQRSRPEGVSRNDLTVFALGSASDLARHERCFADALAELPNVVRLDNDGTLAALRREVGAILAATCHVESEAAAPGAAR